ncbi:MAG: hypothetical protein LBL41_00310 [Bifidobacteriaceae bacterium]|jgi:predicted O-methyltransferase YrrM|nr:hypothetical protein [Bifidobacteriaceae bacterium]
MGNDYENAEYAKDYALKVLHAYDSDAVGAYLGTYKGESAESSIQTASFCDYIATDKNAQKVVIIGDKEALFTARLLFFAPDRQVTAIYETDDDKDNAVLNIDAISSTSGITAIDRFRAIKGKTADILPRLSDEEYDLLVTCSVGDYDAVLSNYERLLAPTGNLIVTAIFAEPDITNPVNRDALAVKKRNLLQHFVENSGSKRAELLAVGDGVLLV